MTAHHRAPVTVIGLGAMGSALTRALVAAGHPTTVWHRLPGPVDEPVATGAVHAATLVEAVSASPLVVVCVMDHRAMREIVNSLGDAPADRVVVNLTPGSAEEARQTAEWVAARGVAYLDGALLTPPAEVGGEQALAFYAGPKQVYREHEATLAALGGSATYLGEDVGLPALYEVALCGVLWSAWAGLLHALALVSAERVATADFLPHATRWLEQVVAPCVPGLTADVERRDYPGTTLGREAVAIERLVAASRARGVDEGLPGYLLARTEQAIRHGHAGDGFASLIEVLRSPAAE
ncbi:NAD(P)-binding domain-containing protein [Saccharothrix sp. SC076]|nr:NAD(P)-binding domain-containing protein [Saccharothrix obliqua]MBW4716740.1 NAD(P)-binding domain-containing protein [Saccharothrix obliqua]